MNNYNMSDTGINIDLNISYDSFLSKINFEENLVNLSGNTYQYVNYGNIGKLDNDELITIHNTEANHKAIVEGVRNEINDFSYNEYCQNYGEEYNDYISFLIDYIYSIEDIKDIVVLLNQYGILFTENYESFIIRGYSQGDAIELIIPHKLINIWGCTKEGFLKQLPTLKKEISHYCYDAPIAGTIIINDAEFNLDEYLDNNYVSYDTNLKDEIIGHILKEDIKVNKELLKEELYQVFPDTLDYV